MTASIAQKYPECRDDLLLLFVELIESPDGFDHQRLVTALDFLDLVSAEFDDEKGHVLLNNQPLAVCDKTAGALAGLGRDDIFISESTYFYDGGGCC